MVNLEFEKLDTLKLPLVQRFYKSHYPATKPKKNELVIVARRSGDICAVVRFRPIEQFQLLTGMVVNEQYRRQGIGHQLLNYCQQDMISNQVYCFAFTWLASFYQQHDFRTIDIEQLPNSLYILFQRYQNSGKSLVPMKYVPEFSHI
jgi:N-acetylglutamate synthase-like GNAT family acetyltransferase